MIHPSYVELMKVVNDEGDVGEEPVVNSRYSIVCATAKRARQLIDGKQPLIDDSEGKKPLSIAVEELYNRKLKILTDEEASEEQEKLDKKRAEIEAKKEALRLQREAERAAERAAAKQAALENSEEEFDLSDEMSVDVETEDFSDSEENDDTTME